MTSTPASCNKWTDNICQNNIELTALFVFQSSIRRRRPWRLWSDWCKIQWKRNVFGVGDRRNWILPQKRKDFFLIKKIRRRRVECYSSEMLIKFTVTYYFRNISNLAWLAEGNCQQRCEKRAIDYKYWIRIVGDQAWRMLRSGRPPNIRRWIRRHFWHSS